MATALLGIDTGGTFTDFVLVSDGALRVHKVLSNPSAPQQAILLGIHEMGLGEALERGALHIIHGTTVATNAALEGKGVRTVYITNKGLKDVLRIGRQTRPDLYRLTPPRLVSPFQDELMLEIDCRLDASGGEITPLEAFELQSLVRQVEALKPASVAINLLFSFLNPQQEIAIEQCLRDHYFVSRSSDVLPEYREYERGMTTWLNAWLGPLISQYLSKLKARLQPSSLSIMQSSGLTIAADQAANRAVNLLLSGPAGGLAAARFIGDHTATPRLMTFDMGGTSTDVALLDGAIKLTNNGHIAHFPVAIPMADIHTIGAGGGSIAYVDEGGLLQVGPESAGADPGPACYGNGGSRPTVTDANLILGRLREGAFLGGRMSLDPAAAEAAMAPLALALGTTVTELAFGIVRIANEHMTQALRVISIQRGFDPRDFTLMCFGGAGGLHFCDLAESLEMTLAVVPVNGGVLSALGMLAARPGRELVQTCRQVLSAMNEGELDDLFRDLTARGQQELITEGVSNITSARSLDLRYKGQTFTLNVPFDSIPAAIADFHHEHQHRYGHQLAREVELVNLRVHLEAGRAPLSLPKIGGSGTTIDPQEANLPGFSQPVRVMQRHTLVTNARFEGPVLITEDHSTTLVKPGWSATVDELGNLVLERRPGPD